MKTILTLGFFCAATLGAADFDGTWLGEVPYPFNAQHIRLSQQVAIQISQHGTTVTGKLYSDYENAPIIDGKIVGDQVDFIVIAQEQQSNQITETRLHFIGTLKSDGTIDMTRIRESATNAGNSGTYNAKATNAKQTFILKRLP
jgi:hypothetical protein